MHPRQHEAVRIRLGFDSRHSGKNRGGRGTAHLDGATVAMAHIRVAAARRAYGRRMFRHATARLGMAQHGPGQWPELKQKEQHPE